PEKAVLSGKESPCVAGGPAKNHPFPNHPLRLVAFFLTVISARASFHRDFVQADILDRCPNDGEATGLRREHINLIGALSHVAEEAFDRIGRLNMSVHALRELVKRQQVVLAIWDIRSKTRASMIVLLIPFI